MRFHSTRSARIPLYGKGAWAIFGWCARRMWMPSELYPALTDIAAYFNCPPIP